MRNGVSSSRDARIERPDMRIWRITKVKARVR
jgi:hypothetical protein